MDLSRKHLSVTPAFIHQSFDHWDGLNQRGSRSPPPEHRPLATVDTVLA